ncbi:unnamed protein product [Macrosiphum euphorbiae]|uniref:Uncharacterized protein n=1 Tax=Macrosiphum euphorbiae TaxID=13131 RepID=A0AAV0Y0I6_9HEMI|nr:unnamed protein product [Macrosiphum euphorbiae]
MVVLDTSRISLTDVYNNQSLGGISRSSSSGSSSSSGGSSSNGSCKYGSNGVQYKYAGKAGYKVMSDLEKAAKKNNTPVWLEARDSMAFHNMSWEIRHRRAAEEQRKKK